MVCSILWNITHIRKDITLSPLKAGEGDVYGKGIYCSPDVCIAEDYCRLPLELNTKKGKKRCKYIFMCRVNVKKIHYCNKSPCPEAENTDYTVHFTTCKNYWFVNLNNLNYENIRQYGLLVKE
jgi:hypothetical protein